MIQSKQRLIARISSKENLKANLNNKVIKIYPELEDIVITPKNEEQNFLSKQYGYKNIKVKEIEGESLNVTPSLEEQVFEGVYEKIIVNPIEAEEINIAPTQQTQTYEGIYNKVNVEAIEGQNLITTPTINEQVFEGVYTNVKVNPIERENLNITPSLENQTFEGVYGTVEVNAIESEELNIVPSIERQEKEGIFNKVTVEAIKSEELNIVPSMEEQKYNGMYHNVTVKSIESEELNIVPSAEEQIKEGIYNKVTVAGDSNLVSENIKEGITIFGTTGNYKSTGAKIFETEEEMQADTTANEGDLAVVYSESISNMTATTEAQIINFPKTVVLPNQISGFVIINLESVEGSAVFKGTIMCTVSAFKLTGTLPDGTSINCNYSNVGGVYTREMENDVIDFGTPIKCSNASQWNDNIGYFMLVDNSYFGGLYAYKRITTDDVYFTPTNSISLDENNNFIWDKTYNGNYAIPKEVVSNFIAKCESYCVETSRPELNNSNSTNSAFIYNGKLTKILYNYTSNNTEYCSFDNILFYDFNTERWWICADNFTSDVDTTSMELLQYDVTNDNLIITSVTPVNTPRESQPCLDIIPETIEGFLNDGGSESLWEHTVDGVLQSRTKYSKLGIDCKYRYYGYNIVST